MSTKKAHLQKNARQGEGVPLTMVRQSVDSSGEVMSLEIDLRNLPVPDRRYTADVVALVQSDEFVRMIFGQTQVDGIKLRSLLDIHFPKNAIHRFLRSLEKIDSTLEHLKSKYGIQPAQITTVVEEPSQTIGLTANMIMASVSNRESGLDFFHMSSFSTAEARRGGNLYADPIVRVSLPTSLFFSLIAQLNSIKASLPEEIELA